MESSPPTTAAKSSKVRLMCSYGGHIVPRPNKKTLFYLGGETRIVSISAAATLSSFVAHLSATLSISAAFNVKYQIPGHDLDSLVSLSTDDDLIIMLEEVQSLLPPSRIRLFLFPTKSAHAETTQPESTQCQSVLCHPKTETWFIDALNSARMMQKGDSSATVSGQNEALSGGGVVSAAESIVLETNSSFGSTSSSVSVTNLPSAKTEDDEAAGLNVNPENKAKSPSQDSVLSYRGTTNLAPYPQTGGSPTVPFTGFPVSMHYDQQQQQWHQFVHTGNPTYYSQPMNQYQPQPLYHHPNQPYPIYVLPSAPPQQQYGLSMQCGLADTRTAASLASSGTTHEASANPFKHEFVALSNNVPQGAVDVDCQRESSSTTSPMSGHEFEDDPLRVQIYKSQPPLPTLPSQYQTITTGTVLSEALSRLRMDVP